LTLKLSLLYRWIAAVWMLLLAIGLAGDPYRASINGHQVMLDGQSKLLSWVQPQSAAYGQVSRLAWSFMKDTVPVADNGLKVYLTYAIFDKKTLRGLNWPHNPAGLYAMLVDSSVAYYAYAGDDQVVALAQETLDYQLAHGTTPASWPWPSVPYASSEPGALTYGECIQPGALCDGAHVIEPDKVAELGYGYLQFYKLTANLRYRDAALACADALANHVRPGDATHSPWSFRVNAETNVEVERYSANTVASIRLFDELIRLKLGSTDDYRMARGLAWDWLMAYPMRTNMWSGYFEDITSLDPSSNRNQYSPMETARYLLEHPELDPDWQSHVTQLIAFVEQTFGRDTKEEAGLQYGALVISEHESYMLKMGSHTARYASVNALLYARTGDLVAREKAFRAFNWATYLCSPTGLVNVESYDKEWWFSDGYGDYIRHFMAGMGAVPAWAPASENHLLHSTSVVTRVAYGQHEIVYQTFDPDSTEIVRLTAAPLSILAGTTSLEQRADLQAPGYLLEPLAEGGVVLHIRHAQGDQVTINLP
jgi:hypothetical protein